MNMHEAERVEDPDRRLGDAAETGVDRSQPAEDEPHHQCAAAGGERQGHAADDDGEQPYQPAEEDAEADEDHVRRRGAPVGIADRLRRPLDLRHRPDKRQDVAAVDPAPAAIGIGMLERVNRDRKTPRANSPLARSASECPSRLRLVSTTSSDSIGMSRRPGSLTSGR